MNLGPVIEVAIGLIFVWTVLSLTTIQIQEWITTRLDKRAKDLEDAIEEMLANENLRAQFYDHPVIRGLTAKKRKHPSKTAAWFYRFPLVRGFTKEKRKLPSYIPRQQFSLALFDIAMTAGTESSLLQQGLLKIRDDLKHDQQMSSQDVVIVELNLLVEFARSAAATEAGTAFTKNSLDVLKLETQRFLVKFPEYKPVIEAAMEEAKKHKAEIDNLLKNKNAPQGKDPFTDLRRGITALSVISPEVNQTLNALLLNVDQYVAQGETQLAKARQNVEKWFDDSMDRVTGTFKRYSQWMALIIGFLVALLLNVDSINLTLYLWQEPAVRQVLVAEASKTVEQQPPSIDDSQNPPDAVNSAQQQLAALNLPVGWGVSDYALNSCALFPGQQQSFGVRIPFTTNCLNTPHTNDRSNLVTKLFGFFITALATMQGAPFWFDMLKRVVNLRGTGPSPAEKGK
jgi:hypothetical protein